MYNRIISYPEKFSFQHNNQFGFRSTHLNTHVLLLTDKIQRTIIIVGNGTYSSSIFFDLCIAFQILIQFTIIFYEPR